MAITKHLKMMSVCAIAVTALVFSNGNTAHADYPTKTVTLVSPYGAGGAADLAARILGNTATELLGQSIAVVNKTGGAGVVGSMSVVTAAPDGYTLLLSRVGSQAAVPAMNKRTPYKWDQFTFLGLLELNPFALTVNADSPYKTFADLEKAIKGGASLSYSSAGVGALQHLGIVVLLDQMKIDPAQLKHVPYKGGGAAGAAVIGGHVDIFFQNLSGVIGHMQGGKLRALAMTTDERSPSAPEVPTFKELGYPEMNVVLGWSGLWGPPELPKDVTAKWVDVLAKLKSDKKWIEATEKLGSVPYILPPEATKVFVKKQYDVFETVSEKLGLTIK
ncbi:MAG: tripartite tricarboxylate transporter substrate binding protein [Proteobacteria bacterium]|nr:tripartite tricarboxylate transporter substrate binding protein [Pseudomonadota bacterium]